MTFKEELERRLLKVLQLEKQLRIAREEYSAFLNASNKKENGR